MTIWDIRRAEQVPIWQERIRQCRSSGMTVRRWCEENQIQAKTYYRWEKRCLENATEIIRTEQTGTLTKIIPESLPSNREETECSSSNASAELVIHYGCVIMDISSQMPVDKIAALVYALNSHV